MVHQKTGIDVVGVVQEGLALGGLLFPPDAGRLILTYGWRAAYLITGVITIGGEC